MIVHVTVVNAFQDGHAGGNPAGVVLDADALTPGIRQYVATKAGFSETAFVSRSEKADFRLEFYTPTEQIADCGHATVGTFSHLAEMGFVSGPNTSKETVDGIRGVTLSENMVFMEQPVPVFEVLDERARGVGTAEVLAALKINTDALLPELKPVVANNGVALLIVPLRNQDAVRRVEPDFDAVEAISRKLQVSLFYVFSRETQVSGRDAGVRMFAPTIGIPEESATGMAAGPLACYLHEFAGLKKSVFHLEQGNLMVPPSPSLLEVRLAATDNVVYGVTVGGRAGRAGTVMIPIPANVREL